MENKKLIWLAKSIIFISIINPTIYARTYFGIFSNALNMGMVFSPVILLEQLNNKLYDQTNSSNEAKKSKEELATEEARMQLTKDRAIAIDAYFEKYDMPLKGFGMTMVIEAEKNDLDWRLLPAISVRESTGGKNACKTVKNNAFGWASCRIGFESTEKAIQTIAYHLGGNHEKTAIYYSNKDIVGILQSYNPPSIVPKYAEQVIAIMNKIHKSSES